MIRGDVMSSISVSLKVLEEREEALTRMSRRVGSIESEFAAIRNALDWDVRNENGIDRDMQKILDRLRGIEAGLRKAGVFLQDTKKAYETAEEKLKQSYSRIGEGYKYRVVINTNIWDKLLENEKVREYLWNSGKQIVLGNFTDEVTLLGTAGQIVLGFTGLDVVGDIRDLTADIVKWKWSWSHVGQTLIDIVALVPVIGLVKYGDEAVEVIKSGLKNGGKLIEEGSEIAAKYWDEVSKVIEKHWEEACAVIRRNGEELIKALKKYGEEVAEAVSGKWNELIERINSYWGEAMKNLEKFRDEFAETFKNCWEQVAASGSKATDEMIEEVSGKWNEFVGAVKQTWDKVSEQGTKLLDEATTIVGNKSDEIAKLVTSSWNDTCEAVGKYWDNVAATLGGYWKGSLKLRGAANSGEELLEAEVKHGDTIIEAAGEGVYNIKYGRSIIQDTKGFMDDLISIIEKRGLSTESFNQLRSKSSSLLTDAEKTSIKAIRDSIPMPTEDTLMQKVIPKGDIQKYLDGSYSPQVKGYVTRAQDAKQLIDYDDIYNSLRLDYKHTAFNLMEDESLGVIKFKTSNASSAKIPYSPEMGGNVVDGPPFTGNGFTAATNGQAIPEFKFNNYISLQDGAELYEVTKSGQEILRGLYIKDAGEFIPVN